MLSVNELYSIEELRLRAKARLPKAIFDFFDGGAEDEITLNANRQAFKDQFIVPQGLNDVSHVDTSTMILDHFFSFPCAIAPTGAVGFGWRNGDLAIARAASDHHIPYTLSTTATASIEKIARFVPGRLWFQAYVLKDQDFFFKLLQRAYHCDYEAIMITIDLPVGGKRERDLRNHFSVPFKFTSRNLSDFATRPRWAIPMLLGGIPKFENLVGMRNTYHQDANQTSSVGKYYDPSFDWDALKRVRDYWTRKLIVKGVQSPIDAQRLVELGVDAIVVSNHGGRQLDGAQATLRALPAILKIVDGKIPVFVDGGIRRGSDIFKALAMGAQGTLIGRATLYGALAGGNEGANRALDILQDEFKRTMQLSGMRTIGEIHHYGTYLLANK
ncbi:alpha-hydroxy acid oxidase [Polynucleobacter kasalickyi]|uniref:(S)-mandelate dehydrogenase n=1 Tax=Polynucleobacter kasalickyi TaxID=1938817 RepID=A0A1W1Y723_9BURK|nr:alpha-hydroxy acid oxidase [Polynucleobacter kasalickyi]SMC31924.1 (S)-mandelate dehydrogenase [Polynucleobacter kasalickyi]